MFAPASYSALPSDVTAYPTDDRTRYPTEGMPPARMPAPAEMAATMATPRQPRRGGTAAKSADCAWCRYGKPAAVGSVLGGIAAAAMGANVSTYMAAGAGLGLGWGAMRGGKRR